ncbi:hypothetical protein Emag_000730 [Eimeria magna]
MADRQTETAAADRDTQKRTAAAAKTDRNEQQQQQRQTETSSSSSSSSSRQQETEKSSSSSRDTWKILPLVYHHRAKRAKQTNTPLALKLQPPAATAAEAAAAAAAAGGKRHAESGRFSAELYRDSMHASFFGMKSIPYTSSNSTIRATPKDAKHQQRCKSRCSSTCSSRDVAAEMQQQRCSSRDAAADAAADAETPHGDSSIKERQISPALKESLKLGVSEFDSCICWIFKD